MISKNAFLPILIICCIFYLFGCAEREEPTVAQGSTSVADDAILRAEASLEAAGISFSFEEPADLLTLEDFIPDPGDLADAEVQANLEAAITELNTALSELEQQTESGMLGSISDRALIHLHLGFAYTFDAISRLLISDDPEETFFIDNDAENPWYTIGISPSVQAELNATTNPQEYPLVFTVKERQAIIDAVDLIDDAIAKPLEPNIQPQFSSVDRQPYTGSAIWHFQKAAILFSEYKPEIMETVDLLNIALEVMRALLQELTEIWGFTYTPPVR